MKYQISMVALSMALMTLIAAEAVAQEQPVAIQGHQAVFVDPITGQVRAPTDAEMAELSRVIEQEKAIQPRSGGAPAGTQFRWRTARLANGIEVRVSAVPERLQSALYAEPGPDGELRVEHVQGAAAAAQEAGR